MEESQRGELEDFEESLDKSAQEIAAHYEEADEERIHGIVGGQVSLQVRMVHLHAAVNHRHRILP